MHPLIDDLLQFKDSEIESKINELTKKYFMATNYDLKNQLIMVLETYKGEMARRKSIEWQKIQEERNKDLDKLININ